MDPTTEQWIDMLTAGLRQDKEQRVADDLNADISPMVQGHMPGDWPNAFVWPDVSKGGQTLGPIAATLGAMGSEMVVIVTESYHSNSETRLDGTKWPEKGMQTAFEAGWADKVLVAEGVLAIGKTRNGPVFQVTLPYRRGETLTWSDPIVLIDGENGTMGGYLSRMLTRGMESPNLLDEAIALAPRPPESMSPRQTRLTFFAAMLASVGSEMGCRIAVAATSEEDNDVVARVLARAGEIERHTFNA